ncbi:MAG: excinuclease ABC subunit UvrC [Lactobacillaceae bacterium]|jgi:excinuclease ABC subunit C|nr:excinuclease ABC subunit UvrC [Lactobacillaceae bacterium]
MININHGLEILKNKIKNAPSKPGVYRMLGEDGEVLYVGKAKNIKKRIISYSHIEKLPLRLQRMVSEIEDMEFIIVETEAKALLLENELIKRLEPRYNILLRDDKTFPHLVIDVQSEFPALRKYRGKRDDKSKYFGPFASIPAVNNVLGLIQKAFLIRSCRDSVFNTRHRPCMLYQIKRCSAPCIGGKITKEEYRHLVNEAAAFLEGKNSNLQQELSKEMEKASENLDYEKAISLRDRIKTLTTIQQGQNLEYAAIKSADFIALARRGDLVCIQVFFIRSGQNCGNAPYFPKQIKGAADEEIMEAFLSSFYTRHIPPKEVIISLGLENKDFIEDAIQAKISVYKKGNKAKVTELVLKNAKEAMDRKIAEESSIKNNLHEFAEIFGLSSEPERIEIYDNSHIQGSYAIGAMVVAAKEGFDKKQYRTFNIKNSEITNDDFAMMREVLSRRFAKINPENKPDVIIIDGGLGQLNAVHDSLKSFNLDGITVIAMSKGSDRNAGKELYHVKGRESFSLPFQSPIAFYLQNLRDEAHRFAIGTHRKKRGKSMSKSRLDDVEGIGAKRKKDLLNHFGSVEQIIEASVEDIMKVDGISKKTAEKIYNYFHN